MATSTTALALSLLVLVATHGCSAKTARDSESSHTESKILSALKAINQALEHFENITQKSLKFHKQNSDVLHQSLRILRQNGDVLSSLWRLPGNVRDEITEQNEKVIELVRNATSNVERLTRDNVALKIHLENKDKEVHRLGTELRAVKEENEELVSKVEKLQTSLEDAVSEVEDLKRREKVLNRTVTSQAALIQDIHPLVVQHNVTRQVAQFNRTKDWKALRRGLEAVLEEDSLACRQLKNVSYDDDSPLWTVGLLGYEELAATLLWGSQDPDVSDGEGCTLLHGAAQGGHEGLARALLARGARVEARGGRTGWTPLVYAARWDRLAVVKLLKERGAQLNAATADGETALHWAAWEGHLDVVRYLVAAGASTTARNRWGRTPLEKARLHGQTDVVEYLSQFPH